VTVHRKAREPEISFQARVRCKSFPTTARPLMVVRILPSESATGDCRGGTGRKTAQSRTKPGPETRGRAEGPVHADNDPRGEAKSRRAFLREDHLPDSALVRSPVVEVRTLGRPGDHA
jgi:hypothetical protein